VYHRRDLGLAPFRLPWTATLKGGVLTPGWLTGPLVDVFGRAHLRVPASVVREIEAAVLRATGGDNLPRIERTVEPVAVLVERPTDVISLGARREELLHTVPREGAINPPDRRFKDSE
jgi:hypothetical protein